NAQKDLIANQFLEYRLEIAARDALPLGDFGRTHRGLATVIGDVEHRLDRKHQFLGQSDHVARTPCPRVLLVRFSPCERVGTSGVDSSGAEAAFLSTPLL